MNTHFVYNKKSNCNISNRKDNTIKKIIIRLNPDYINEFNNLLDININYTISKKINYIDSLEWYNMPEYDNQDNGEQYPILYIYFFKKEDIEDFNNIIKSYNININISNNITQSFYYPSKWEIFKKDKWITKESIKPKYSINILSLGRYQDNRRFTSKTLDDMNIDYKIFVEPFEYDEYCKTIDKNKIIKLPDNYHKYKQGGIPARNFIKWYSTNILNEEKHWILDDNIDGFYRFHNNKKIIIKSGYIFTSIENFTNRYTNVGLAGFNYYSMCPEISINRPPYTKNGKVFSCILITNALYNWRGIYNEDIDLALRLLKDNYVNLEFNHILINKKCSGTVKGGNTDTIYKDNTQEDENLKKQMGYKKKVDYLIKLHPDIKITYKALKSKEYHHNVDYSKFKNNQLIKKENYNEIINKENKIILI